MSEQVTELIWERLVAIMADVPAIPKGQQNKAQGYSFRGIDDVYQTLHRLFAKHEVVILPGVISTEYVQQPHGRNQNLATDARLLLTYTFVTTDGSKATITVQGESRDYADKATNQAMSAALKYGLLQMFLIPIEDTAEADHGSPTIDTQEAHEQERAQAVLSAKNRLVDILGTAERAQAHWVEYVGGVDVDLLDLDVIVAAAQEVREAVVPVTDQGTDTTADGQGGHHRPSDEMISDQEDTT